MPGLLRIDSHPTFFSVRALLKVGHRCNNACLFCHADDRSGDETFETLSHKIALARSLGATSIVFSGGEPTLRADLIALADEAQKLGLSFGLVTNARRLASQELAAALIARGMNYAYVSLEAAEPALHDRLVGSQGAFAQTLAAIHALQGRVRELCVNAVVTQHNLRALCGLVDLLSALPSLKLKFSFPQPKGSALRSFDTVVPSLASASAAVLDAFRHARNQSSPLLLGHEGFPLCLLPGLEDLQDNLRSEGFAWMSEVGEQGFSPIDDDLLTKPSGCANCSLQRQCPGIYREYASRCGIEELRPQVEAAHKGIIALEPRRLSPLDAAAREQASQEQRCWVRLTWACNNNCLFCLDGEIDRSHSRDAAELRAEIVDGRRRGAERLVLSGGEPTTHPAFLELVRVGKLAGYRWMQCITNGRMFSYGTFLERAIAAGLNELTVSLHGHTPELHDKIVGVPGAFAQTSAGVKAAIASRRVVVSIDIVLNAHNVEHLPAMIDTFLDWGIREFDWLHIIPFGNAWKRREEGVFYDLEAQAPQLRKALASAQARGAKVWLNRFPPEHAEGFESLLQDPHKLFDEVRGREAEFTRWSQQGVPLPCREPKRCALCYLRGLCDAFARSRELLSSREIPSGRMSLPRQHKLPPLRIRKLEVLTEAPESCAPWLQALEVQELRIRIDHPAELQKVLSAEGTLWGVPLRSIVVSSSQALAEALSINGTFDLIVDLDHDLAQALVGASEFFSRIVLRQPIYSSLGDPVARDLPASWFARLPSDLRTEGIAQCLTGLTPQVWSPQLDLDAINASGELDPPAFVTAFLREFRVKSVRCRSCRLHSSCLGMHLNWVRIHGFAALQPLEPA